MPVQRDDPYSAFNFLVELSGLGLDPAAPAAGFTEVSGLDFEVPAIEYRNGNERTAMRKMPGLPKYTHITLKRGVIGDLIFWQWILQAQRGQAERQSGAIVLLDESHEPVMRWRFRRAWPTAYRGPTLKATGNEVAIEEIVLAHEGLELD